MESEKVKEIKQVLEFIVNANCSRIEINYSGYLHADILTLINELESENERLTEERDLFKNQFNELEPRFFDLREENQQLKDRIAELEKENKENAFYTKGYAQGIKNTYEVVIPDKLKQFAERLKDKADGICVKNDILYAIKSSEIDETLKEFLK